MIIKLVKSNEKHHVLIQDTRGRIIHEKFNSEEKARAFLNDRYDRKVSVINLDNHLTDLEKGT